MSVKSVCLTYQWRRWYQCASDQWYSGHRCSSESVSVWSIFQWSVALNLPACTARHCRCSPVFSKRTPHIPRWTLISSPFISSHSFRPPFISSRSLRPLSRRPKFISSHSLRPKIILSQTHFVPYTMSLYSLPLLQLWYAWLTWRKDKHKRKKYSHWNLVNHIKFFSFAI